MAGQLHSGGVVYHQDTIGLSRLDWAAPIDQALRQVITGRLGRVVRLPAQDIAHFRPSVIWTPDHGVALKAVQAQSNAIHIPTNGYQPCAVTGLCSNGDSEEREDQQDVYLVVAN